MVLPQIVRRVDKFIEKTAFGKKATDGDKAVKREMSGIMFVNGRVRGHVSGFMDGVFDYLKGDIAKSRILKSTGFVTIERMKII